MFLNSIPRSLYILILFFAVYSTSIAREHNFVLTDTTDTETGTVEVATLTADSVAAKQQQQPMILWTRKNTVGMNFNEVAFVNWNAGGNNSISAIFHGNFERRYQKDLLSWRNQATIRYGLNAQEGQQLRKSEDEIRFSSTAGYRRDSTSNFKYSAKFNFNTQFAVGYRYPNTERAISKFMAPGYTFLGIGTEYSDPVEDFTAYFSPLTMKSTFVLDRFLANEGSFGVRPAIRDEEGNIIQEGERIRMELGILFTSGFSKEIFENVKVDNQISLYTDYLNKFGNIDIDWQLQVDLVVNEFIKASIGTHIRYDDDVKIKEDINGDGRLETLGPRVQFKQMLGVGVVYNF